MGKRLHWADVAKGIAMLSIMLGHVNAGIIGGIDLGFVYAYELTVFYLLAGYFLKKEKITTKYFTEKFKRLMLPYFYTCFALLFFDVLLDDRMTLQVTERMKHYLAISFFASGGISELGGGVVFNGAVGAIWFLPALFFAILFVQLILNFTEDDRTRVWIAIGLYFLGLISTSFIWLPFSIQSAMTSVLFVLFGYFYREKSLDQKIKIWMYPIFLVVFVIGVVFEWDTIYIVGNTYRDALMSPVIAIAGSLLVFGLGKALKGDKVFAFIGKNSLYVMCVHLFTMNSFGRYFEKIVKWSKIVGPYNQWVWVACYIISGCLGGLAIYGIHHGLKKLEYPARVTRIMLLNKDGKRDLTTDVCRGIIIIIMLLGHEQIDGGLRKVIYSFHMAAFVILSGIYYKSDRGIKDTLKRMMRSFLLPYLLFCLGHLILHLNDGMSVSDRIKYYVMGISFSKRLFQDVASVGPVYFVLLLFITRLLYAIVDKLKIDAWLKSLIVVAISYLGVILGNHGLWLPWSFDVALYCLIYYHIGYLIRKGNIDRYITSNPWLYFALSPVWAYAIYTTSMEIAMRSYMPYGMVIAGAVSGFCLVYMLSNYIKDSFVLISKALAFIGKQSIYILICHDLLSGYVHNYLVTFRHKNPETFLFACRAYIIQISIGIILGIVISWLNKGLNNLKCAENKS